MPQGLVRPGSGLFPLLGLSRIMIVGQFVDAELGEEMLVKETKD